MSRDVFRKIVRGVREYNDYFELKRDCTGFLGFHLFINARRSYDVLLTDFPPMR